MSGSRGARGFTLLEVTAALVLLGLGLTMLYAGHLAALEVASKNAAAAAAASLARSLLAAAEVDALTENQGTQGIYRWSNERIVGDDGHTKLRITVVWGRNGDGDKVEVWSVLPGDAGGR